MICGCGYRMVHADSKAFASGEQPNVAKSENDELKALRKRNRLLEQENEVLRRAAAYLSQANLPGKGSPRCET